jgi:hypothetical protein
MSKAKVLVVTFGGRAGTRARAQRRTISNLARLILEQALEQQAGAHENGTAVRSQREAACWLAG